MAEEFADLGEISGCGFAEVEGPPYDLIINATSASLQGEMPELPVGLVGRRDDLLRHGLWPRAHPVHAVGEIAACGAHHQGLGHAGGAGRGVFLAWRGIRPDTQPVLEALAQHT